MRIPAYINDFNQWQNGFQHFYPVTVRFSETDAFGHVNNTNAFVYFEHARIQFFKNSGLMAKWTAGSGDNIPVTADLHCDFFRQMFFDEELRVGVKTAETGSTSADLHYMVLNSEGEICLTGRGRMVQVNKKTGKPAPWDEEARQALLSGNAD